ncbi:MAG: alkaline phosphatase family protein [Fidelibacterota bacterium]
MVKVLISKRNLSVFLISLLFLLYFTAAASPQFGKTENVVVVVIDGARYTETFGDTSHSFIPSMHSISLEGSIVDSFYNDGYTYTRRAIPAIWTGAWTEVRDTVVNNISTQYTVLPTMFEYFRKQKGIRSDKVYYVLKFIVNLWLMSYHQEYGPEYWPVYHSSGQDDEDVLNEALSLLTLKQPKLLYVYFADVDHHGHSGVWESYTQAIQRVDSHVGILWSKIQESSNYRNRTAMIVTNDHGRHDDEHGGFQNHGGDDEGCRHIMLLAVGPDFKKGYTSNKYRTIRDIAPTIGYLLGFETEYSTGEVMRELFVEKTGINIKTGKIYGERNSLRAYPNPFNNEIIFEYSTRTESEYRITIFNILGEVVNVLTGNLLEAGEKRIKWNGTDHTGIPLPSGIYLYVGEKTVSQDGERERLFGKLVLVK